MMSAIKSLIRILAVRIFSRRLNTIEKYRDLHKGESCYLIGDGTSLKWFDLKTFENKPSIIVGYAMFHKDADLLKNSYCFLVEPFWFYPYIFVNKKLTKNPIQFKYKKYIKTNKDKKFFINLSNILGVRGENIQFILKSINNFKLFEELKSENINPFHGSFRASICLSIFMGYDKIYLVGFDYTHTPSISKHWYEKGKGVIFDQPDYEKRFIEIVSKHVEIITIVNDTRSNKLNFKRYQDLSGQPPGFKENEELVQQDFLNTLKKWKWYQV